MTDQVPNGSWGLGKKQEWEEKPSGLTVTWSRRESWFRVQWAEKECGVVRNELDPPDTLLEQAIDFLRDTFKIFLSLGASRLASTTPDPSWWWSSCTHSHRCSSSPIQPLLAPVPQPPPLARAIPPWRRECRSPALGVKFNGYLNTIVPRLKLLAWSSPPSS